MNEKENKEYKDCMLLLVVYDLVLFYYFFYLHGDLRYLYTLISRACLKKHGVAWNNCGK